MKTILVVDDEHAILETLSDLLGDEGYRVTRATNGKDGLERLKQEKPDLVIVDYMMPVSDGRELIHDLRNLPGYRSIPVVMMSAASREDALSLNHPESKFEVSAFLAKPFSLEEILAVILRLIGAGGA